MKAIRVMLVALAALVTFSAAPAGAQSSNSSPCVPGSTSQQYPPQNCGVAANRTEVAPGGSITLTGQCPSGTTSVTFRLLPGNVDLGAATPAGDGSYSRTVTIPANTRPGNYQIQARCEGVQGAGVTRTVAITVVGAAAASLPRTGADGVPMLTIAGLALVAVGGVAVMSVRRRRTGV